MSIGISVNVGLNKVTSNVFHANPLQSCEKDAIAMHCIAIHQEGFDPALSTLLLGKNATHDNVVNAVKGAAKKLQAGDLFLFTFAGHGTSKFGEDAAEEVDEHDESIVLTDHFLLDNFWRSDLWPKFKPGVRALAIADCCHSGTVLVSGPSPFPLGEPTPNEENAAGVMPTLREIAAEERQKELQAFPEFYNSQLETSGEQINCRRIFLSACLDNEKAADGPEHGAFTKSLLDVWANGAFNGNYLELIDKIKEPFNNTSQTPNLTPFGIPDFTTERPFTI